MILRRDLKVAGETLSHYSAMFRRLGFKPMNTAYATIKGLEVMRLFKKGQFAAWIEAIGDGTEARFIHQLFGLYGS